MKYALPKPKPTILTYVQWGFRLTAVILLIIPCCILCAVSDVTTFLLSGVCKIAKTQKEWYTVNIKGVK
jgi:CO dehydrogenase/acetyl-CoA synthase alpha subunit